MIEPCTAHKYAIWNTPFVTGLAKHSTNLVTLLPVPRVHSNLSRAAGHRWLCFSLLHYPFCLAFAFASAPPPSSQHALCSCTAAFPSILLSVCLIAGDGYVVYLTQNRTPLLFQRVEPLSSAQDGGPGLINALPPPETTDGVNSL